MPASSSSKTRRIMASTSASAASTARALSTSRATKASSASWSMAWAAAAMRGRSTTARSGGAVADALQLGDDLERGGDEAQVRGRGLAQGEHADAQLVDGELELVDGAV